MLKIPFLLKKSTAGQGSLEHVVINNPKKILEGKLANLFACEVYLPDIKQSCLMYGNNPIDTVCLASEFVKMYLQFLINRGYTINEVENGEPWRKLEKKDPQLLLQEKIEEIKTNKQISQEDKDKILRIIKESFGGESSPIKEQVNRLI